MSICTHMWVYRHMCIGVRAHVYTCVYVPMYTCVGVCAHVFICVMHMPICT